MVVCRDPDEFLAATTVWGNPVRFTPTRQFRTEVAMRRIGEVTCLRTKATPTILHMGEATHTPAAFTFSDEGSPTTTRNGIDFRPSELFVYTGAEYYHRVDHAYGYRNVIVPRELLAVPLGTCRIRPSPRSFQWLRWVHIAAMRSLASQDDLVRALFACLATAEDVVPFQDGKQTGAILEFVRDIHTRPDVNERTFRRYCNRHLGMGPQEYARMCRLDLARRDLASADPAQTLVRDVAQRYGFGRGLKRFAHSYRQRFGEPPSTTLRNRLSEIVPIAFC